MNIAERKTWARIMAHIEDRQERVGAAIDESIEGIPTGFEPLKDDEFRLWFEQQVAGSPPVPIEAPDGTVRVASPWVAMLPLTENGNAILRRYERVTRGLYA